MTTQEKDQTVADIPIKAKKRKELKRHELEDYEPGVTRGEALKILEKVATSRKPFQKHGKPPGPASS